MNPPCLALKHSSGWFAAGQEMAQALALLSDGAFKLFVYLCLNADRASGQMPLRQTELARQLGKSLRSITTYLEELRRRGVCHLQPAANQHQTGRIEIAEAFWPYLSPAPAPADPEQSRYIGQVRTLFLSQPCVQSSFGAADQKMAASWYRQNLPLETVEHAYLLGCTRKYVSLLNHPEGAPIASLSYFANLLEEVAQEQVSPSYWRHLAHGLRRLKSQWQQALETRPSAYANFAQANMQTQGETR
jgi:hypothetical protein